jgi:mycofactocin system transcriptional regulator
MATTRDRNPTGAGRPESTSHAAIEQAAFELFSTQGFDGTTLDQIASAVGVNRRTLFRYYPSKADIPWGRFDQTLSEFERMLRELPTDWPIHRAVLEGIVRFNDVPDDAHPSHRTRMRLIFDTPALEAHSALRYAQWRRIVAGFVAERCGVSDDELLPQVAGYAALGIALAAYEQWMRDETCDLSDVLRRSMDELRSVLD